MEISGIDSTLREKPKTVAIVLGQSRKLLHNQFAQDFASVSACRRGRTFISMQANVFWHLCTSSANRMDIIFFYRNHCASAMLMRMVCAKHSLNHKIYQRLRQIMFVREYRYFQTDKAIKQITVWCPMGSTLNCLDDSCMFPLGQNRTKFAHFRYYPSPTLSPHLLTYV